MERSADFPDTSTFANYISHLRNVCFFSGSSVTCLTPAVRHVANGLKKRHDKSSGSPKFIRIKLLARIIRRETDAMGFTQA